MMAKVVYDENTDYWPEGQTVIDRNGKLVFPIARSDARDMRSESDAKRVADMMNQGESIEAIRARHKRRRQPHPA